jgi:hypothetical protein
MDGVLRKVQPEEFNSSRDIIPSAQGSGVAAEAQAADLLLEKLSDKFHKLVSNNPSPIEVSLATMSILETVARFSNDGASIVARSEVSLREAFSNISAEKSILYAVSDLYLNCKNHLLSVINSEISENFLPANLVVEELDSILSWFQRRLNSLEQTKSTYKLGQEGFFAVKIFNDIERNSNFGFLIRGGIDLDSRGHDELWLVTKLLCNGKVVYESEERPIGTKGERKVGRLIVDSFEQFVPYSVIDWPPELNGKLASCTCVVSVVDRSGVTCFSNRITESIRKTHDSLTGGDKNLSLNISENASGDSLLKGHKIFNIQTSRDENQIQITLDCLVMNQNNMPVVLSISTIDCYGDILRTEEFSLQCVTRIARFYNIQSIFNDEDSIDCSTHIEIVVLDSKNKELCRSIVLL